jgi:signal transduction histidine kinase
MGHVRNWLGVPLIASGEVIGLYTVDKAVPKLFSQTQVQLAETLAAQAAIAIQNARLFEQVQVSNEQLHALSRRLLEIQETERRQIARELHDEIGQILTGLKLLLDMDDRLPASKARNNLKKAQTLVDELMETVDELSFELRPAMLDDLGVLPALLWHFGRYMEQTGINVSFKHSGVEGRRFIPEIETAIYRIVQEALTNVARHAQEKEVTVRLWARQDRLRVQIEDRGIGFDPKIALANSASIGLSGMHKRTALLGGNLELHSVRGNGTSVLAELPLSIRPVQEATYDQTYT